METGRALRTIRDARLYRADFATFDEYVKVRWKMARNRAYQYIDGARVVENVHHGGHFEISERQIRPLTKLDPDQQREAWQMACDAAPKDDTGAAQLTAKIVADAAEKVAAQYEPPRPDNVVELRRAKSVTIPVHDPERAVRILLESCERRDLVELLSELGYTLHRIGALNGYPQAIREMLARMDALAR